MTLDNTRFGTIRYEELDTIRFVSGLIGFPDLREFVVLSTKEGSPFRWLQSIEDPSVAFLVTDPDNFVSNYSPEAPEGLAERLEMSPDDPRMVFVTVTIPKGKPGELSLNLVGPIVVNATKRTAMQVVLDGEAYKIKHRVILRTEETAEAA